MDGMRYTFRFKMIFAVLCSAVAILIYIVWGEAFIASFLKGESNGGDLDLTLRSGCAYLNIMLWGLPPFALVQVYAGTLREAGETRAPMFAGICAITGSCSEREHVTWLSPTRRIFRLRGVMCPLTEPVPRQGGNCCALWTTFVWQRDGCAVGTGALLWSTGPTVCRRCSLACRKSA